MRIFRSNVRSRGFVLFRSFRRCLIRQNMPLPQTKKIRNGIIIGASLSISYFLYQKYSNWYYAYPIDVGQPDEISKHIETTEGHQRLIELLKEPSPENANKEVVITGEQGTGKSMAASLVLHPEYLSKWFSPDPVTRLLPRMFKPYYLGTRPWLVIYAKGNLEDTDNKFFKKTLLSALTKTEKKYPIHINTELSWSDMFNELSSGPGGVKRVAARFVTSNPFIVAWVIANRTLKAGPGIKSKIANFIFDMALLAELRKTASEIEDEKQKRIISEFKNYLEEHPGWLIVIDDVQSLTGISHYLPKKGGTIICTTNDIGALGFNRESIIEFNGFTEKEAINYIRESLYKEESNEEVKALADAFKYQRGDLFYFNPLGLDHACATINAQSVFSIREYLRLMKKNPLVYFSEERAGRSHLPLVHSLSFTMLLFRTEVKLKSYGLLTSICPEEKLLFVIGSLEHTDIPNELACTIFCSSGDESEMDYIRARNTLIRYRLISRSGENSLSIHPLFHRIFRAHFLASIRRENNLNVFHFSYWYLTVMRLFGYETLIDAEIKEMKKEVEANIESTRTLIKIEPHLLMFKLFIEGIHQLFYQKQNRLVFLDILSRKEYALGQYEEAKKLFLQLLEFKKKFYGTESIEIAYTQNDLGRTYRSLGGVENLSVSIECHNQALKIASRFLKPDDPFIIRSLLYSGETYTVYGDEKNAQKALECLVKARDLAKETLGTEHRDYATILTTMGNAYLHIRGEHNNREAIVHFEHALSIYSRKENKSDIEMVSVGEIYAGISTAYWALGNNELAIRYSHDSLKIMKVYLGKEHLHVAHVLGNLGALYLADDGKKSIEMAIEYFKEALKINRKYSEHGLLIGSNLNNLGKAYKKLGGEGNLQKAIQYLSGSLECLQYVFQPTHINNQRISFTLGLCYLQIGNFHEASSLIKNALESYKIHLSQEDIFVKDALKDLEEVESILEENRSRLDAETVAKIEEFKLWATQLDVVSDFVAIP